MKTATVVIQTSTPLSKKNYEELEELGFKVTAVIGEQFCRVRGSYEGDVVAALKSLSFVIGVSRYTP